MAVCNSLRVLKLLKSWCCLILKLVLPACSIVLGSHELFLNSALALLFFFKTILELGNVSLQLLETGLCVQLGLRREKERGKRGEWRKERMEGGREEGRERGVFSGSSFMKMLNDTNVIDVQCTLTLLSLCSSERISSSWPSSVLLDFDKEPTLLSASPSC